MKTIGIIVVALMLTAGVAMGQKIDEVRMERDIAVAENVLQTLIKQQFENQRMFFQLEINGSYQEGYGVTFRMPADFTTPLAFNFSNGQGDIVIWDGATSNIYGTYNNNSQNPVIVDRREIEVRDKERAVQTARASRDREASQLRLREKSEVSLDSIRDVYNQRVIDAAMTFITDYGDMISQLGAKEKIVITNQGDQPKMWLGRIVSAPNRTLLSVEANKSDLVLYKQGKLTRDQLLKKMTIVNTEAITTVQPDFELLSSIFNRLYRADLSTTFFADGMYYEQLKDFGVVFYMHVFSSNQTYENQFDMPTIKATDLTQDERDKKVVELYPKFEKEFKDNMIEYGRTVKSLKPEELLVFNIKMTQCSACGIPESLEFSIKGSVLNEYNAGKIDKAVAIGKIAVKKGPAQ